MILALSLICFRIQPHLNHTRLSYIQNFLNRTIKELASYDKEIKDQSTKIQKMKDESKDSHDIKQQVANSQCAIPPMS